MGYFIENSENPCVVEAWYFDGSIQSVETLLATYQRAGIVSYSEDNLGTFVSILTKNSLYIVRSGEWIVLKNSNWYVEEPNAFEDVYMPYTPKDSCELENNMPKAPPKKSMLEVHDPMSLIVSSVSYDGKFFPNLKEAKEAVLGDFISACIDDYIEECGLGDYDNFSKKDVTNVIIQHKDMLIKLLSSLE